MRPETDWIRTPAPALRIISDDQWAAAHARLEGIRSQLLRASGGRISVRRRDIESAYLLPGFARCAVCGGSLGVLSGTNGNGRRHVYGCNSYLKRGTSVCGNSLRLPIERVDDAVLRTLAGDVLRPPVVMAVIDGVIEALAPHQRTQDLERCHISLRKVDQAIGNLARAIAAAGELDELLEELRAARVQRDDLVQTITAFERANVERFDRRAIAAKVQEHVHGWRTLLATQQVQDGRQLLREVLAGPLRFTPDARTYRFEDEARVGAIVAQMAGVAPYVVAVPGIEPGFHG